MRVPIPIFGQSYQHRSKPLSAQVTRNFIPEIIEDGSAKSRYILHRFPGLSLFGTDGTTNACRGMLEHKDILYKVTGTTLYRVGADGVHVSLGTIPGSARCILVGLLDNIIIVSAGFVYQWDGMTLAEITDEDLEEPNSVAHINNQILYDGAGGRWSSSDVGDATSISGLNYASAESNADDLIRVFTMNQVVYLFGSRTIETWWNSGDGNPPFDRFEEGIIQVGLAALHSVAHNDKLAYFLGDDSRVYKLFGSQASPISTIPLHDTFSGYGTVADAIGFCIAIHNQNLYVLTFPTENKTWAYSETTGLWFELSSGTDGGRWRANSYAYCYRKHLVGDYNSGKIYEIDPDVFTENGATLICERVIGPLHAGLVGQPGVLAEMNSFELVMETGVGLGSGQGVNPKIVLQVSDDGGRSWSTEMWGSVGRSGEFILKVSWAALGSFYERLIRLRTSDPVRYSIHGAFAEVEIGI